MKKFKKVVLGMFLAVSFGTVLGNSSADASERSVGDRYDGQRVSIQSVMDPTRVVDWSLENRHNAIMFTNGGRWNQQWNMTYRQAEDAYIFTVGANLTGDTGFLGATNSFSAKGHRYVGSELISAEAMQWRLIPSGTHANGDVYMLQNVAYNTVLDIQDNDVHLDQNLILHAQHGRNNQRFILNTLN
ncbi:hypothetical protein D920_01679 [Enterococcus faecalis 13-SD-W-01]|nr:hypothetical protein D920_01679 [Enterococcus faecalis 13-SD-W-01]